MLKNKITGYLLFLIITTFFTVFSIMVNNTYLEIKKTQDKILNIPQAKPIDPAIDTSFLNTLESQIYFSKEQVPSANLDIKNFQSSSSATLQLQ